MLQQSSSADTTLFVTGASDTYLRDRVAALTAQLLAMQKAEGNMSDDAKAVRMGAYWQHFVAEFKNTGHCHLLQACLRDAVFLLAAGIDHLALTGTCHTQCRAK